MTREKTSIIRVELVTVVYHDIKRITVVLFISLLIINPVSPVVIVDSEDVSSSLILYVPAVTDGGGRLIVINITLIPNGTGNITLNGADRLGEDTVSSARIGYIMGILLSGKDPFRYDAIIDFGGNLASIEGPSASLAIALGFYSLAQENIPPPLLPHSVITGAVSPDGLSVMVGGIPEKFDAACSINASFFVLPLSNIFDEQLIDNNGKCSVDVIEAVGIVSLYNMLRNLTQSYTTLLPAYPEEFGEEMKKAAYSFIDDINKENVTDEKIQLLINEALKNIDLGHYYTAASLAYTGYINMLIKTMYEKYTDLGSIHSLMLGLIEKINQTRIELDNTERALLGQPTVKLYTLEVLGATEARLWMSEAYAKESLESDNYSEALELASYAMARYETAKLWLGLAHINWASSPSINLDLFNKTMNNYYLFLNDMLVYSESLLGEVTDETIHTYFQEIKDLASRINNAENMNNVFLRYGLASELGYRLTRFLSMINMINSSVTSEYLKEIWVNFGLFYMYSVKMGFAPMIPAAYAEYAKYGIDDPISSVSLLDNAISNLLPILFYGFGGEAWEPHNRYMQPGGLTSNELVLVMDGWEFIGIVSTIIVFLVSFREGMRRRYY